MKFRHLGAVLVAAASLAMLAGPVRADNYPVKDGTGAPQTFCSKLVGAVQYPCHLVMGLFGGVPTAATMTNTGALDVTPVAIPPGASTSANQASELTKLDTLHTDNGALATSANQAATQANAGASASKAMSVQGIASGLPFPVTGTFWQSTQPVSVLTLPLPSGAATAAAQTAVQGTFGSTTAIKSVFYDINGNPIVWSDFAPSGNASLAVTTTSAPVSLPNTDATIVVTNLGPSDVTFRLGTGTPVALSTDTYLPAGKSMPIGVGSNTSLAAIAASGTATLKIAQGAGTPALFGTGALPPSTAPIGDVGSASFGGTGAACTLLTLPGTGGTYSIGQGVLNNATAGSVTNQTCTVGRYAVGPFTITGLRLLASNTTITNGQFRIHFYVTAPTYSSGNGAALVTAHAGHFCSIDVTLGSTSGGQVFADGADGFGVPVVGGSCTRQLTTGQVIYPVIEARGAYAWTAAQTFTIFPQGFN